MPSILLLGGGYTLSRVAKKLHPDSFVITSRSSETTSNFAKLGFLAAQVDSTDTESVIEALTKYPSIERIVDSVPPIKDEPTAGVLSVIEAAKRANRNLDLIVYLSTTGVYGESGGSQVNEESICRPQHKQGEARLACENLYRSSGFRTSILRLPAIYGPERGIERSLREGTYRIIDDGLRWTNRIHVEDLSDTIELLIRANLQDVPDILCVSDDHPTTQREIAQAYCEELQLPFPRSVSFEEAAAKGHHTMLSNQRVMNEKLRNFLGRNLRYPSYRAWLLEELRSSKV